MTNEPNWGKDEELMNQAVRHRIRITYETEVLDKSINEPPPIEEVIEFTAEGILKPVVFARASGFLNLLTPNPEKEAYNEFRS